MRTNIDNPPSSSASGTIYSNGGTYTGDGNNNRAIAHGLGVRPSCVVIQSFGTGYNYILSAASTVCQVALHSPVAVTDRDATYFYVGTDVTSANNAGTTYTWTALK